ncbi:pyrimidine/purine nucleoside phosphorylase [Flavobacterium sp. W21_SRS_FM6]|uniref:pyrimidine/purine nucleoside phosphorylase n=1 Tax=Flavobacterium sp. W21_SRS_FM6 TaxID=3240268 RepID=UPI003F9218BC
MFKVNEYFNGNVTSMAFQTATLPATVGVMAPGEYEFGTSQFETMTVVSGALTVLLPGASVWQTFSNNEVFTVEANVKFQVKVTRDTAYLCTYGK